MQLRSLLWNTNHRDPNASWEGTDVPSGSGLLAREVVAGGLVDPPPGYGPASLGRSRREWGMSAPTATLLPLYGLTTRLALAVGVLAIFVVVNLILQAILARALRSRSVHAGLRVLVRQGLRVVLWLAGLASALGTLGVNISALIAGLGLGGFALGFALRDILANLVAGVLILVYRPFTVGRDHHRGRPERYGRCHRSALHGADQRGQACPGPQPDHLHQRGRGDPAGASDGGSDGGHGRGSDLKARRVRRPAARPGSAVR